ncbi:MAG TPA: TonB-dependent receptor [Chitinophaga sp.]|nr:TonB-dependent receptor [Chitinophaga sp.]
MKHFVFSTILLLLFLNVLAQKRRITGTVTDKENNNPVPGVSVKAAGKAVFAQTDARGHFSIEVPEGVTSLEFSFIGYQKQSASLSGASALNIQLESTASGLNEVVVVGYGTQSKREFTGSAARISSAVIKDVPVQSFDQALSGRAAGVSIASPNGVLNNPPVIRIRGINSISLSSYPLVVIDGIPTNTGNISTSTAVPNNPLSDIDPADIESVDVLKDAASTSIYGSRAAAGVLLITTKRGKAGKSKVSYDGWTGVTKAARLPELLNAQQYMDIKNEGVLNAKILGGNENNPAVASALYFPSYREDGSLVDTKWYDYIYRTAISHNHTVSLSGGTKATSYYFSANYSDQQGFIVDNSFKRKAVRFNVDHEATKWLKLKAGGAYNTTFNQSQNTGSLPNSTFLIIGAARMATALSPNVPVYNADGSYNLNQTSGTLGMGNNLVTNTLFNAAALFDLSRYTSENEHFLGNVGATIKLLKPLELTTTYSLDRLRTETVAFQSAKLGSTAYSTGGSVTNVTALRNNWNWTSTLSFNQTFGRHHVTALAGYDVQKFENSSWGAAQSKASDDFFEEYQGSWGSITTSGNGLAEKAFISYFSRLTYDLDNKYFITANFRRDGNSALGNDTKFGNFGGVSAGWVLSEEKFFHSNTINNLKLRASWGRVGNGNLPSEYAALNLYSAALYGTAATWYISQAGNSNLGWETSEQTNFGVDLGLLDNRIQVEATYFNNDVNGLILSTPQSPSKGIPNNSILLNVGSMYNRGIEFSVNAGIIRKADFSWDASFNYTHVNNKVTALADGNADIVGYTHTTSETSNVTRVGESIGSLYGARTAGVNPENGRRIFINKNGEKVQYSAVVKSGETNWTYLDGTPASAISASDYYLLGNALPKWYGGLSNNFRYKGFDLGINFTYAGGNYVMNGTKSTLRDQRFYNNHTGILNRWTTAGQKTDVPRVVYNDVISNGTSYPISDNVEKGDFLRLQNVLLGYRVPARLLGNSGISSIRVYAQASNLFLVTGYTGTDPESSSNGNANTTPGVEKNAVGQGRTYTLGINVGF